MKKLSFILLSIILLTAIGCSKDEAEMQTKGKIRFTCTSDNPYKAYIDGSYKGNIPGNSFDEYYVEPGEHTCKVEQISGYVFYPTVQTADFVVSAGSEYEFVFP